MKRHAITEAKAIEILRSGDELSTGMLKPLGLTMELFLVWCQTTDQARATCRAEIIRRFDARKVTA